MAERRYTDEEVAAIFSAAAELPQTRPLPAPRDEGLTLTDLQDIGREVGIAPEAVARAARSLDVRGRAASHRLLGLPIGVERTVELGRRLTDAEWEHLIVDLREVFNARGTVRSQGSLRQWTNGNLQALLEPTPTGDRLRLQTVKGSARAWMGAGGLAAGVGGAVAIAGAAAGQLGHSVPGIAFLLVTGLGMFAAGALQLPGWARARRGQMEEIAARLALAGEPSHPELPPTQHD